MVIYIACLTGLLSELISKLRIKYYKTIKLAMAKPIVYNEKRRIIDKKIGLYVFGFIDLSNTFDNKYYKFYTFIKIDLLLRVISLYFFAET